MSHPKAILGLLAVIIFYLSSSVNAQINLKTGYSMSFLSDPHTDEVISAFNQSRSYSRSFKDLRRMHGFEAGIRLKSGIHALEASYMGGYQSLRANGTEPGGSGTRKDQIKFNVQSAGLSYQISNGPFGIGIEMQHQWYITSASLTLPDQSFKNVQEMWAKKLYLMFILEGSGSVDLALIPYYIFPSRVYDTGPLREFLQVDAEPAREKWNRFGVSVVFYNGRK